MKYLYTHPIPEQAQTGESNSLGQQLAKHGLLDGGTAIESIASEASDLTLEGQYRWGGRISTMLAHELDELADAGIPALPLYRPERTFGNAGYYSIESADITPLHPNRREVWQYDASLTFIGTRGNYRRRLSTNPSQVDHPWGNDTRALVGLPAAASRVEWRDPDTAETTPATADVTRSAEFADVDLYDAQAAPYDSPELVADVPYAREGEVDVSVFDTQGHADRSDSDGIRQWEKAWVPAHDYTGTPVLSNGLVRLTLDTDTGLAAEHWDGGGAGAWAAESLPASDWALWDVDIRSIGLAAVTARLRFRDTTSNDTYPLDCHLQRGYADPQWTITSGSAVPSGLESLLDPVSSPQIGRPGATQNVIARGEL
ncbi:hypothetical protein [Halosimplex pelagicum]|uniref:Uncharacterized protein n=1 Tax=Halosimplex pelagicum TaxID=869886 RepID=A0A7D5TR55_9EURY|nr:hypothetical protein [Halosimplex pelagicum]QLH80992.1 hypothetical protein HZS54_04785 [Halosimplex pelagicum]